MRFAVKNKKKKVRAYELGVGNAMEMQLLAEGAIRKREDGRYELFSQEAVHGTGELASAGDFFKVDEVDGKHFPYPNERSWFLANHVAVGGDEYEQLNKPLAIWEYADSMCEEVEYLIENGKMTINREDKDHYFNAVLWGAPLSQSMDAVVLFYSVDRDEDGKIQDISFNFVARTEFDNSYTYCEE